MSISSETLKVGDRAPEFSLAAVNLPERFRLAEHLARGTVVLEFLRGTW
jgi:peroxiredoxin